MPPMSWAWGCVRVCQCVWLGTSGRYEQDGYTHSSGLIDLWSAAVPRLPIGSSVLRKTGTKLTFNRVATAAAHVLLGPHHHRR